MNESLAILIDSGISEWWPIALAALAGLVCSLFAFRVERRWKLADKYDTEEKAALKKELAQFGLGLATEREERRADVIREIDCRKDKDADLGADIGDIREEISHDYGERGKPRPRWRKGE